MGFLDWLSSPYSSMAHSLRGNDLGSLRRGTYRIAPGPSGVPIVQLDLEFKRQLRPVSNPDMTLAVIMDRSGSMAETFNDGHAYDICSTILRYTLQAGVGYDMVFYSDRPTYAGHIGSDSELRRAIAANQPSGGTTVTAAIKGAIERYKKRAGIYLIVITDGEFSDKDAVEQYVANELIPQFKPSQPYALRLHFVGAGEGVDHEFLHRMEDLATGKGVPLVAAHHHAHMRHAHDDVLDELDGAFMGVGTNVLIGEAAHVAKGHGPEVHDEHALVKRIGDVTTRAWQDGEAVKMAFLPKVVSLGIEFSQVHPPKLDLSIRMLDGSNAERHMGWQIPLPRTGSPGAPGMRANWLVDLIKGETPEQKAARVENAQLAEANASAEQRRQSADLARLARGGLPTMAEKRLKELGKGGGEDGALFTSNLTPDEMALLRRNGFRARGMVMGSAMFHVGQAYASAFNDCEVTVLSEAYNEATRLAVSRLEQELKLIGAHGVVGVKLAMARHEWGEKSVEVQVLGTAIEGPGKAPAHPWMSDLSGQEWWALHRAGYEPAGLVWGHCTWFVLTTFADELIATNFDNVEISHWSDALKQARNRAVAHMRGQATALGATGITGMHIEHRLDEVRLSGGTDEVYKREHHNVVLSCTGTAIKLRADAPGLVPATRLVLSLGDNMLHSQHMAGSSEAALAEEI